MSTMKAMIIRQHGRPEVLELAEVPMPEPGPGQALVKVGAVSVNSYLDVTNRQGGINYRTYPMPNILGSEHAGQLVALGPGTESPLAIGSTVAVVNVIPCGVCDWCRDGHMHGCPNVDIIGVSVPGAYAQYTVVPVANLRAVPEHISVLQAAGVNVLGPLAVQQFLEARAEPGQTVLVQAGASGSGIMAASVAKALGLTVYGTTRTPSKLEPLMALGIFDAVIDTSAPKPEDTFADLTHGHGMDIVIDNLGDQALWSLSLAALAPTGTVVVSGAKFGGKVTVDTQRIYQMGQRIIGLRMASPTAREQFWALVHEGTVTPVVDQVFPLERAADAHHYVEAGLNIGRSVITVD